MQQIVEMKKKSKTASRPLRSEQIPATSAMLYEMEERLVHQMDAGVSSLKADSHEMKADIHQIKSELHRVALLVEEQNARNKYVMDGYAQIYDLLVRNNS